MGCIGHPSNYSVTLLITYAAPSKVYSKSPLSSRVNQVTRNIHWIAQSTWIGGLGLHREPQYTDSHLFKAAAFFFSPGGQTFQNHRRIYTKPLMVLTVWIYINLFTNNDTAVRMIWISLHVVATDCTSKKTNVPNTMKPVYNDHLYNKINYLWFSQ